MLSTGQQAATKPESKLDILLANITQKVRDNYDKLNRLESLLNRLEERTPAENKKAGPPEPCLYGPGFLYQINNLNTELFHQLERFDALLDTLDTCI